MRHRWNTTLVKALAGLLAAGAGLGAAFAVAGVGSTELGQTSTAPVFGANFPVVQLSTTPESKPYTTPKGVLTSWRYHSSADSPAGTVRLQLFKPVETAGMYEAVAASETKTLDPATPYEFSERMPVEQGWVLGLDPDMNSEVGITIPMSPADQMYQLASEVEVGQTGTATGPFPDYRVNVSATVEPDDDGDGFGDRTQDECPTDASTQAECIAPKTKITKRPANRTTQQKVTYKFKSNEPRSTFECKLDRKRYKPCTSPRKFKAREGRHKFRVRAIDPAGNVDPTPAKDKFKALG